MANWSNRHRRRLHMIQDDSTRPEETAPVTSEKDVSPEIPDDVICNKTDTAAEADSKEQSPALVAHDNKPRSKSDKPKRKKASARKQSQQSPSSRRFFGNRNHMNYFRHTLALAILVTFGYLYSQQRSAETDDRNASAETFSNWEGIAEAPAFNTNTVSISQQKIPEPIAITQEGNSDLNGIPTGLANWIESQDSKKTPESEVAEHNHNSRNPVNSNNVSELEKRSLSLWNEPGLADRKQHNENFKTHTNEAINRQVESITSLSGTTEQELQNQIQNRVPSNSKKMNRQHSRADNVPGTVDSWREFKLGSGKQTTVCVVDKSISNDTLLLSTIFAGIRREWLSDVSRSQEQSLVLLIANQQVTKGVSGKYFTQYTPSPQQKSQEMQRKINAAKPSRIVYLSRGNDDRGQIKFSSEQESIDALMSVPGMFRITSQEKSSGYFPGQPQQVHIELPAQSQAQQTATVELLFTALTGAWNGSEYQASRDTYGQAKQDSTTQEFPTREQQDENSIQPQQKKRRVEILPSPSAYRQQARAKNNRTRNNFFKLPPSPVKRNTPGTAKSF